MKQSLLTKLEMLIERHEEISLLLGMPEVINDQDRFRTLSKEYAELEPVVVSFKQFTALNSDIAVNNDLLNDPELADLAQEELQSSKKQLEKVEQQLQSLLLPKDPNDNCNVYLEIRAGTGGEEAALFVGDLLRMYMRYSQTKNWGIELISESLSETGGYKEVILRVIGKDVYSHFKFESGAHRVQRVPVTESQGRIHTSACTVAVMPQVDIISDIELNPSELRIDTYRASGAGGQHVNRTDSAVRITHIPTGTVAECQDERSQHKNKAKAMSLLKSKILSAKQSKQQSEQAETRRNLVGSGDRSERIRTYNFPQGRITDHRINLTIYKLPEVIEGDLDCVIQPLIQEHQADLLASLAD